MVCGENQSVPVSENGIGKIGSNLPLHESNSKVKMDVVSQGFNR